jgi:hypothetical protein
MTKPIPSKRAPVADLIRTKAREAVDLTERAGRLPWWHRKRRKLMRETDAKMREGFELLGAKDSNP